MPEGSGPDRERLALSMRNMARQIFLRALSETTIEKAFSRHISYERGILRVCDDLFNLQDYSRTVVISIGKAGHTMASALRDQLGDTLEGIVASPAQSLTQVRGFRYFEGGHPTPNAESLRAAEAILKTLNAQNESSFVIFLLSGGGSSIVESPIDDQISLADLIQTYKALVTSSAPIAEMNAVRKHLSAVKGGRMAQAAYPAQQVSVIVSDVPDAALDALASGPTMPDSSTVEDCQNIASKYGVLPRFPASIRELFERHALTETPKSDDPIFQRSRWWPILSNSAVLANAAEEAQRLGFHVEIDNGCDDWDFERAAEYLLTRLRELRAKYARACLISGGEVTVEVVNGGVGGRNQQFTLALAKKIPGQNITVLSAGTDGIDGNSPATGAIADGTTLDRARTRALDVAASLASFNAHPLFEALGDAIITGYTGNNLRDVRVLLSY